MSSVYDRVRNPQAATAARAGASASDFGALRRHKYALLVTYRRSGEPVPTPVWFGLDGPERLYVRTGADAAKVKRVKANPRVLVGPSDARGKPLGPLCGGAARLVPAPERDHAESVLRASYGLGRRLYERLLGERSPSTYLEVTPA
jgi:PPOX class probable F420-dependent enzyme